MRVKIINKSADLTGGFVSKFTTGRIFEKEHRLRGDVTGREISLGDQVVIQVRVLDEDRRQIEFRLMEAGGEEVARRKGRFRERR